MVICRPGPYICSEWDWGGLPHWLLRDPEMRVRVNYPGYQKAVKRYFEELLPKLAPLQWSNGGPIIAFQVENEYGDYPDQDHEHLNWLTEIMKSHFSELLFISDGGHTIRHTNMFMAAARTSKEVRNLPKGRRFEPISCLRFKWRCDKYTIRLINESIMHYTIIMV